MSAPIEFAYENTPDGVEFSLPSLKTVGLAHLAYVAEYRIETHFDSASHFVRLINGGELHFAYNFDGRLLELKGSYVSFRITPEGACLVEPYGVAPD